MNGPNRRERGSALLIALFIAATIGTVLMSYLELTSAHNRAVVRSQQWNSIVPLMEAGVEEALAQLYYTNSNPLNNGWTITGTGFTKTRYLAFGRYSVTFSNTPSPTIWSSGYMRIPLSQGELSRAVLVRTTNGALFAMGLVAKGDVTFSGNNVVIDSFDSLGTNINWNPGIRKANGTVGAISGAVTPEDITIQNANIYGSIYVSPVGSYSAGAQGRVGDLTWAGPGIQPGAAFNDLNISIPDVVIPAGLSSAIPVPGNNVILASGNYTSVGISSTLTVSTNVVATVLVNGNISADILLEPGARLTVFMHGDTLSLSGDGAINQGTNSNAINLLIYGTKRFTSFKLSGNSRFKGMLYAPQAVFSCGGGGNDVVDYSGAAIVGQAGMNGHFNFHYDENVGRNGPRGPLVIIGWREL